MSLGKSRSRTRLYVLFITLFMGLVVMMQVSPFLERDERWFGKTRVIAPWFRGTKVLLDRDYDGFRTRVLVTAAGYSCSTEGHGGKSNSSGGTPILPFSPNWVLGDHIYSHGDGEYMVTKIYGGVTIRKAFGFYFVNEQPLELQPR